MDILSSLQSIGFDWQVALAHLVNFLLVLWLLNHFVFAPLQETIRKRKEKIQTGVNQADKAKRKLQIAEEEREEILSAAREKRQDIIADAHDQAEAIIEEARSDARERAEEIIASGRKQVESERKQMRADMKGAIGQLAVRSAEKILEREVTEDDHDRLIQQVVTTHSDGS